ncbi:putative ribonuclease H-like domain-containing protein [Tanacetum coccineum]
MTHPHPNRRFVPQPVLTRSGKINTAGVSVNTAGARINIVDRPVNTAGSKPTMNHPRSISNVYKKGYSQNGVAKRRNRTLIEAARTVLVDSKLSTTFWAEAVNTACYVLNRVLVNKPHTKTPYELICGRTPLIDFMKPFRCLVTILNTRDHLGKFDGKTEEGFFVGYFMVSKAMRVFNKRTRIVEKTLNIRFLENAPNVTGNGPDWLFDVDSLTISMNYVPVIAGNQTNGIAGKRDNIIAGQANKKIEPEQEYILIPFCITDPLISQGPKDSKEDVGIKPTKVNESGASDKGEEDEQDTRSEFERLLQQEKIFGNAYDDEDVGEEADINNLETTMNVSYTYEKGFDYDEVFALVARIEAIKLFLAYASFMGFIEYQMDVKSAFLYGTIEEEVYVCQPPGFEDPHFPDKVYKVEKALYGLHQAPKAWYEKLSTYLIENGFRRGTIDKTLFIKKDKGDILLVHVYVDDIIFGSTKKSLCEEFEGLKVQQMEDGIFISQDKYVVEILKKFYFTTVNTASTLIGANKALVKDEEAEAVDIHLYSSMIRSLMYLTDSRPDIMFAVCACYPRDSPFDLEAFSDSDYAGASLDRKSTTRGVIDPKSIA